MTTRTPRNGPGRPPTIKDPQGTICLAAAKLFAADGYESTSLQDVARAVGMTKAGLYHYFPTKQALFDAIVLSTLCDLIRGAEAVSRGDGGPQDKLTGFMVAHASFFEANKDRYRASFFGRAGGAMTDFTAEQLTLRRRYVRILEALLAELHQSGPAEDGDIAILARGILGMLNWMARWYRPDGPKSATEIATKYANLVLAGIDNR